MHFMPYFRNALNMTKTLDKRDKILHFSVYVIPNDLLVIFIIRYLKMLLI